MRAKIFALQVIFAITVLASSACGQFGQPDERIRPTLATVTRTAELAHGQDIHAETPGALIEPPPTYTPIPTFTLEPSATPKPAAPTSLTGVGHFGVDRNQLTGELVEDPALLERRPLAVKISNAPARWTRPQSGLGQADLVYEHVTEGSITRFTAIFYGQTPPDIGPIRSARLIDLELPAMYDAALVFSGSSIGVSRKLFSSDFRNRILRTYVPGYYRTGEDKPYEHTLYARPEELWQELEQRGENKAPQLTPVLAFSELAPRGGMAADLLTVRYRKFTTIEWRYDRASGRYYRWADGEEHADANSGEQLSAANVVVLVVPHRLDTTICEFQSDSTCLAYSTEILLSGEGHALLLRDGHAYEVTWSRQLRNDLLTLLDRNRRPFPLKTGNTWFQVMPADYHDSYSVGSP